MVNKALKYYDKILNIIFPYGNDSTGLFIGELAFSASDFMLYAELGIMLGLLASAVIGDALLIATAHIK